jgi:hypothetical protein
MVIQIYKLDYKVKNIYINALNIISPILEHYIYTRQVYQAAPFTR